VFFICGVKNAAVDVYLRLLNLPGLQAGSQLVPTTCSAIACCAPIEAALALFFTLSEPAIAAAQMPMPNRVINSVFMLNPLKSKLNAYFKTTKKLHNPLFGG
jgi:hypothetical protein